MDGPLIELGLHAIEPLGGPPLRQCEVLWHKFMA